MLVIIIIIIIRCFNFICRTENRYHDRNSDCVAGCGAGGRAHVKTVCCLKDVFYGYTYDHVQSVMKFC